MSTKITDDTFHLMVEMPEDRRIERELRFAIDFLRANRLSESAKWVAELLSSMKNRNSSKNFSIIFRLKIDQ